MKTLKVSIIVPVYGAEKYIARSAKSLFSQTYSNIEYVFVNDCTPDKSIDVLRNVIKEFTYREQQIKIIEHFQNGGSASARNTGLHNATGDYLMWVDADDFLDNDAIQKCVDQIGDADIITFGVVKHTVRGIIAMANIVYNNVEEQLCGIIKHDCHHGLWGRMYKREISVKHKISFFDGQNMGEDFQWVVRNFAHSKKIKIISDAMYHYEFMNEDSIVHKPSFAKKQQAKFNYEIARKEIYGMSNKIDKALNIKKANLLVGLLESCCEGNEGKDIFNSLNSEVSQLSNVAMSAIGIEHRIMFYIKQYQIARLYIIVATIVDNLLKKLRNGK